MSSFLRRGPAELIAAPDDVPLVRH